MAIAGRGVRMMRDKPARSPALAPAAGDSWCLWPLDNRIRHSAGVTVNATTIEASTAIP